MGRLWSIVVVVGCVVLAARARAEESPEAGWQRVDSRYCTIWVDPSLEAKKLNQKVKTWMIRPQAVRVQKADTPEGQLAAKCDTIFRKAQELLDMYPPGVHVAVKIANSHTQIRDVHAAQYGYGTEAVAFYVFENNTIYATAKEFSTSVLAHEMAHCIIDHYFGVRPPRKIEEMLAMYVDAHLEE